MSRENHLDRKLLKRPDFFVEKGRALLGTLAAQSRGIWGVIGALAVATAAYYGYAAWKDRRLGQDWLAYYQAMELPQDQRAAKLKTVYDGASHSRAKQVAAASLGDHYAASLQVKTRTSKVDTDPESTLSLDQAAAAALDWYTKALDFSFLLPLERDLLVINQGNAYEAQQKWAEALARYQSVAQGTSEARPVGMLHTGRLLEKQGKADEAKKLYQQVSADFPNTEYARMARNYLRRASSPLLAAPGKP
ncbi:tetratricopeptide repeat protein [bacterium]|nr:tetratricopeptide repeat protein [bacterium]